MTKELTRKQLYNLVWRKSISQIAKEYGLSDRGLGKLCERHGIPTPPRGYWAKIKAGQKIKKPPLLFSQNTCERAILSKNEKQLVEPFKEPKCKYQDELNEIIEFENAPENKIKVPMRLTKHHSIVKQHENDRKKWNKSYPNKVERRRDRVLSCLLFALEDRGFNVYYEDNIYRIKVVSFLENAYVGIHQYIKRTRRELTEEEKADRFSSGKYTYDDEYTDFLIINIYSPYGRKHKDFLETEDKPIEDFMNESIIEISKEILDDRQKRLDREESERIRFEREEKIRKDNERREALLQDSANWDKAKQIRSFVETVNNAIPLNVEINEWTEWALNFANEIDPLKNQIKSLEKSNVVIE